MAPSIRGGVVIDAHVSSVAVIADGTDHLVLHGGGIIDILYKAGCGICFSERCEGIEEVIAFVGVGEDIAGYAHAEEGCEGEKADESARMHFAE